MAVPAAPQQQSEEVDATFSLLRHAPTNGGFPAAAAPLLYLLVEAAPKASPAAAHFCSASTSGSSAATSPALNLSSSPAITTIRRAATTDEERAEAAVKTETGVSGREHGSTAPRCEQSVYTASGSHREQPVQPPQRPTASECPLELEGSARLKPPPAAAAAGPWGPSRRMPSESGSAGPPALRRLASPPLRSPPRRMKFVSLGKQALRYVVFVPLEAKAGEGGSHR